MIKKNLYLLLLVGVFACNNGEEVIDEGQEVETAQEQEAFLGEGELIVANPDFKVQKELLNEAEIDFFQKVDTYLGEETLLRTDSVKRYYERQEDGTYRHYLNEFDFERIDGLIQDAFVDYQVSYLPFESENDPVNLSFNYSQGLAYTVSGSIVRFSNKVTSTKVSCGTTHCGTYVNQNGKKVYEKIKKVEKW